jgi:hypothetical protein
VSSPPSLADIRPAHECAYQSIDSSVLIHSGCNFAGVHLDPLAGDGPGVSRAAASRAAWPRQGFDIHGPQDLFDRGSGYGEIVNTLEFALDPSRPQTTCAQLANPFAMLIKNLDCRRELGPAVPRGQTFHSLFSVSPDHFRSVGRDMPHFRQTTLWLSRRRNSSTHRSRLRISASIYAE